MVDVQLFLVVSQLLQYMGDQQGGAVVITGKAACREVLLYLERKQIPGESSLQLSWVWRKELDDESKEQITGVLYLIG